MKLIHKTQVLIVASGSGAAMPQKAVVERGYKGRIYQIHAAATKDLMRISGKDVAGTFVVSGPAVVGDLLPDSHPSKKVAMDFVAKYDKAYGAGTRNQFAGHAEHAWTVLEMTVLVALKKRQAWHQGIPRRAEGCHRGPGPHRVRPRHHELDRHRPLGLPARDRRDADGEKRRLGAGQRIRPAWRGSGLLVHRPGGLTLKD